MSFFNRMKEKLERYSFRSLSFYITIVFGIGFLLMLSSAGYSIYFNYLAFWPYEVLHGQVWRILTAMLYPPVSSSNILLGILSIYIYYNFASVVEKTMGSSAFGLYFFGSILVGELGSIVYYLITGENDPFLPLYTHFSVVMAFAILYPDARIYFNFLIPLKAWWLAVVELVIYVWQLFAGGLSTKIRILAALIPVVLFYLIVSRNRSGAGIIGRFRFWLAQKKRQREWKEQWK